VVAGTSFGMMLANAPVVWLGDAITRRVSLKWVHRISAVVFAVLGGLALWGGPAGVEKNDAPLPAPIAAPIAAPLAAPLAAPQQLLTNEPGPAKL